MKSLFSEKGFLIPWLNMTVPTSWGSCGCKMLVLSFDSLWVAAKDKKREVRGP